MTSGARPSVASAALLGLWCLAVMLVAPSTVARSAAAGVGDITAFSIPTVGSVPDGITAAPDGNLWFAERLGNKIGRITPAGVVTEFPVPTGDSEPLAVVAAPDGNVWFTEFKGNKIGRITPSGTITEFPIPSPDPKPHGITVGPDDNLWFTELNGNKIGRMTLQGEVIDEYHIPTPNSWPSIITTGPDGNLWFGEWKGDKIGRLTPDGVLTEFSTPTAGSQPHGITVGPDGHLWFTEFGVSAIGRISTSGDIDEFPIPTPDSKPAFIASAPDGNLWFTEYNGDRIGRITPAGSITEFQIDPSAGNASRTSPAAPPIRFGPCEVSREWLSGPGWPSCDGPACPIGITAGPDGNLWFTEFQGNRIGRITDLPRPGMTLSPGSGPPGTEVHLNGSGFGSFEDIELTFVNSVAGTEALGSTTTDGGGGFSADVVIPASASRGRAQVVAKGVISRLRTEHPFRVR